MRWVRPHDVKAAVLTYLLLPLHAQVQPLPLCFRRRYGALCFGEARGWPAGVSCSHWPAQRTGHRLSYEVFTWLKWELIHLALIATGVHTVPSSLSKPDPHAAALRAAARSPDAPTLTLTPVVSWQVLWIDCDVAVLRNPFSAAAGRPGRPGAPAGAAADLTHQTNAMHHDLNTGVMLVRRCFGRGLGRGSGRGLGRGAADAEA